MSTRQLRSGWTIGAALALIWASLLLPSASGGAPVGGPAVQGGISGFGDRAFTVKAEAFTSEPAPGSNDTSFDIRPASTRAVSSNPPKNASARAAASDFGLIEALSGPVGPSVEADTAVENSPNEGAYDDGSIRLTAAADRTPRSEANAMSAPTESPASTAGTSRSHSETAVVDGVMTAIARADVSDVSVGPMTIGSARYRADVSLNGVPGGAVANGVIEASDAEFNGIPVVISDDGMAVDETKVPAEQVGIATKAIQEFFSPGGYVDVRVVNPTIEVAKDGTSASVRGGGVSIVMTSNDPQNNYFVSYKLLGGSASAALGAALNVTGDPSALAPGVGQGAAGAGAGAGGVAGGTAAGSASGSASGVGGGRASGSNSQAGGASGGAAQGGEGDVALDGSVLTGVNRDEGGNVLGLVAPWGWPWLPALVIVLTLIGAVGYLPSFDVRRRRIEEIVDPVADRFLRG